ncbi:MAG: hypothetical protein ACTSUK_04035, partial [Promethearchaeota archaeon]
MQFDPKSNKKYPFPNEPTDKFEICLKKSYEQWNSSKYIKIQLVHNQIIKDILDKKKIKLPFSLNLYYVLLFLDSQNYLKPIVKCIRNSTFFINNLRHNT